MPACCWVYASLFYGLFSLNDFIVCNLVCVYMYIRYVRESLVVVTGHFHGWVRK